MDPALAAKLAARRSKSEPEVATVPTESITVDASDLERLLIEEREKNSAVLARICNTMLHAESADPDVYPLQDDSRFLMHTLLSELDDIKGRSPSFAVEVGCGAAPSGVLLSRLRATRRLRAGAIYALGDFEGTRGLTARPLPNATREEVDVWKRMNYRHLNRDPVHGGLLRRYRRQLVF